MFTDDRNYVLAVCLADGNIVMLRSFDDVSPITIRTNLKAPLHAEWSNSRKLLAIAGTEDSDSPQTSPHEYTNLLKFYSVTGTLVYTTAIPYTQVRTNFFNNDRLSIHGVMFLMHVNSAFLDISAQCRRSRGGTTTGDFSSPPGHVSTRHGCQGNTYSSAFK